MTEREDPIRRRRTSGPKRRETIEELYGDVISAKPAGLFDAAPDDLAPPDVSDAPAPPRRAYRPADEGAPGSFKRGGPLHFPRNGGDLTPIVLSHGLMTVLTLGIWRFWQVTAQRRSIWAHTKLAGEPFEYRGTGLEMFIGAALAAVTLVAAVLAGRMILAWLGFVAPPGADLPLSLIDASLMLAALVAAPPLMEVARFRARRYRLRRTRWRGVRFDMRGSGLSLLAVWALWAPVVVATLGLAVPFLSAARERHMTGRTFWGTEPFFFRGSAWRLMPSWAAVWLLLAAPAAIGAAHVWDAVEMAAMSEAFEQQAGLPQYDPAPQADRAPTTPLRIVPPGGETPVRRTDLPPQLAGFGYGAARIRMFMTARRIAGARATCRFGARALFDAWLAVLGRSIWPGVLVNALAVVVALIMVFSLRPGAGGLPDLGADADWRAQGLAIMSLALICGVSALFAMWLIDVVWFRAFFHKLCAATRYEGLETLEHVRQRPHAAAADAEGFADAFDIDGGF